MKISTLSESSRGWIDIVASLERFLESEENYLFIGSEKDIIDIIPNLPDNFEVPIDLIQFCNLKLFEKGELGIREYHWYLSDIIVKLPLISGILSTKFLRQRNYFSAYSKRYLGMLSRRFALEQISSGLSRFGIVIPHYVEPIYSATIVSRDFACSLLEFNRSGLLTYERAFFSLARSSNFICLRIAGGK